MIYNVIIAVVSLALGFLGAYLLLGVFNKRAKREMEAEAELLKKKKEIEEAAEEVLCVRAEHSEKTLAEMYDPDKMPADLRAAHHTLDLIVESCYRKEPFTSDEERLEHLFKLYEKMTTK